MPIPVIVNLEPKKLVVWQKKLSDMGEFLESQEDKEGAHMCYVAAQLMAEKAMKLFLGDNEKIYDA